eukprot:4225469-Pleurochrysis_carterae.AAC.1
MAPASMAQQASPQVSARVPARYQAPSCARLQALALAAHSSFASSSFTSAARAASSVFTSAARAASSCAAFCNSPLSRRASDVAAFNSFSRAAIAAFCESRLATLFVA